MDLARQQKLVAQLVSDHTFCEAFFAAPARVAASEGLAVASQSMAQIHPEQVREFARFQRDRRLAQAEAHLPLTRKALGKRFADLFHSYSLVPPPGTRRFEDALGFVQHLDQHAEANGLEPEWALSLARYEAAQIEAVWLDRRLVFRCLPHAVKKLAAMLAAGEVPEGYCRRISPVLWWRIFPDSRLKHWLG